MIIGLFSETNVMKGSVKSKVALNLTGLRKDVDISRGSSSLKEASLTVNDLDKRRFKQR